VCSKSVSKVIELSKISNSNIDHLDYNWIQWFVGFTDLTQKRYNSTLSNRQTPVNNLPPELKEII
jgi:hypothetical protein